MSDLDTYSLSKDNNFQLIRFSAALGVFISHTFPLAGYGLGGKAQMLGHVSLNVFFIISGFLVCKSFFSRPIHSYFASRALRILPALIAAVLLSTFFLGLLITELTLTSYLSSPDVYEYAVKNIVLILPDIPNTLPGVFLSSEYASTVNAPLWSLPYEVACYIFLALLAFATRAKTDTKVFTISSTLLFLICFSVYAANQITKSNDFAIYFGKDTFRLIGMFFMGVGFYLLRSRIEVSHKVMTFSLAIFVLSLTYRPASIILLYLLIAYAVFYFAYIFRGPFLKFNHLGDYSYGIYIFGYPIQQTIEQIFPKLGLSVFFIVTFAITLTLAILSWHIVEKRALVLKS